MILQCFFVFSFLILLLSPIFNHKWILHNPYHRYRYSREVEIFLRETTHNRAYLLSPTLSLVRVNSPAYFNKRYISISFAMPAERSQYRKNVRPNQQNTVTNNGLQLQSSRFNKRSKNLGTESVIYSEPSRVSVFDRLGTTGARDSPLDIPRFRWRRPSEVC